MNTVISFLPILNHIEKAIALGAIGCIGMLAVDTLPVLIPARGSDAYTIGRKD